MKVLVTGATGAVGAFVLPALRAAGHSVSVLGRHRVAGFDLHHWDLADPAPVLPAAGALVHLAFHHQPGAYRGGEGDDPAGFLRLNREGSLALIAAAGTAGIGRTLFLSSRAVYGDNRRGETLDESDLPTPDSLYGEMKLAVEAATLAAPGGVVLRATGVYGRAANAPVHKWSGLFADYLAGGSIASRAATEVHGADLGAAVALLLAAGPSGVYNVSDLLVDRHELLSGVQRRTGSPHPPPAPDAAPAPGIMATDRLAALGWRPGGHARLRAFLTAEFGPPPQAETDFTATAAIVGGGA